MFHRSKRRTRVGRSGYRRLGIALLGACLSLGVSGAVAQLGALSEETVREFRATYGAEATRRLMAWQHVIAAHGKSPVETKQIAANNYFNRIPWLTDLEHWGEDDYWATPLEMIGTNGGDCEDYSISKYFTLLELDVPTERLLITYVRAPSLGQTHMVLAYYARPDAEPLILDNLNKTILPASQRPDLIPVYSFNGDGLWLAVQRSLGRRVGEPTRLEKWRGLLERMQQQGLLEARPG